MAGIAAVVVLAGLVPGAAAAVGSQKADVTLRYACQFPSGSEQVPVRIQATFPAAVEPRSQIRVQGVSVAATVPRKAVGSLEGSGSVEGVANLDVLMTASQRPASAAWQGLTIPGTKLAGDGAVELTAAGAVPPSTIGAEGDAVFSAGSLSLRLSPAGAGGGSAAAAAMSVSCTPNLGQDTTMVTVPLSGADRTEEPAPPPNSGSGTSPRTRAADDEFCENPMPEDKYNEKFVHLFPPIPDEHVRVSQPNPGCARFGGKANVNKLKAASPMAGDSSVIAAKDQYVYIDDEGRPTNQFRHVAMTYADTLDATFLTFGFMPTTSKMEITQIGNMNLAAVGPQNASEDRETKTWAWAEVWIRLYDVRVNGTPMDVGPKCRTAQPVMLALTGSDHIAPPYAIDKGGRLSGMVNVPAFSGCGVGEDLDRLFTASVSGEGNYVQLTQGPVCFPSQGDINANPCPSIHGYGYTIKPGGEWSGTSGPVVIPVGRNVGIECASSTLKGRFKSGNLLLPKNLGQVTSAVFRDCRGDANFGGAPFTVSVSGLPATIFDDVAGLDRDTGLFSGVFADWSFRMSSPSCSFDISRTSAGGANPKFTHSRAKSEISITELGSGLAARNATPGCPRMTGAPRLTEPFVYPGIQQYIGYGETFE
ncbi:DUF6801 domain-containing protein [Actinomadura sp. 9N407]|uniref:DUF6801 domain-containing protein n=1 Tax=Actinomadura sp. 9N407 TaxID=3375154 RepID=UPI0037BE1098